MNKLLQRLRQRLALLPGPIALTRKIHLQLFGARVGAGTRIPKCLVTWPHQVQIGRDCRLEPDIYFKFDGYWQPGPSIIIGNRTFIGRGVEFNIQEQIDVGDDCLIAAGCLFVDHDHGIELTRRMAEQPSKTARIRIGNNVWVGANSVILKGIQIGDGAVVGAGSVVTKSIPANEIWVGNPARRMRERN